MYWSIIALFEFRADQMIWMIPTFEFTNRILILELATLFIKIDLKTLWEHALEIKSLSSSYGMIANLSNDNLDPLKLQEFVQSLRVLVGI